MKLCETMPIFLTPNFLTLKDKKTIVLRKKVASILKQHGYHTGFVGKWHVNKGSTDTDTEGGGGGGGGDELSSYVKVKEEIQSCGFDFAYAIYEGNIPSGVDSFYSHNHE